MTKEEEKAGPPAGPGVDARGVPVVDPSRNVLDLVEAAIQRQDDLRLVTAAHLTETAKLRADYDEKLREAETARIDAIRAVDVGAVNRAAEVATTQAATLAAQVATSAETLRNQVAAAATAQTVALAAALEPIIKDIADLRRAQYEALGQKAQVVEARSSAEDFAPMVSLLAEIKANQDRQQGGRDRDVDRRAGVTFAQGLIASAIGFLALILAALGFYSAAHRTTPQTPQTPVVTVTVPASK